MEDNSTNGTFVNGEKIKGKKIVIGDGDDISLGQIVEGRELASEFRKFHTLLHSTVTQNTHLCTDITSLLMPFCVLPRLCF